MLLLSVSLSPSNVLSLEMHIRIRESVCLTTIQPVSAFGTATTASMSRNDSCHLIRIFQDDPE
jgi:hypothetical protein